MTNGQPETEPGTDPGLLRVLIVDDHAVVRTGTRQVLETSDDIVVVGEADDGKTARALADDLDPNVVLVDVHLPDCNGIDLSRDLTVKHPEVRIVILSADDDESLVRSAFDVGAMGYLLKTIPRTELVGSVRAAGHGSIVLDPVLTLRKAGKQESSMTVNTSPLTPREMETVVLVTEGLSNRAISDRLGVSSRTVEGHLNHVFAKLGIESRTELVRWALTHRPPFEMN